MSRVCSMSKLKSGILVPPETARGCGEWDSRRCFLPGEALANAGSLDLDELEEKSHLFRAGSIIF